MEEAIDDVLGTLGISALDLPSLVNINGGSGDGDQLSPTGMDTLLSLVGKVKGFEIEGDLTV